MVAPSSGTGGENKGKAKARTGINLEEAMKKINLNDSELDDVFVGEEEIADLS